jgi:hypothetical protein
VCAPIRNALRRVRKALAASAAYKEHEDGAELMESVRRAGRDRIAYHRRKEPRPTIRPTLTQRYVCRKAECDVEWADGQACTY